MPIAEASFWSAIIGDEAKAATEEASPSPDNSQNMALLQANVSSAPIFKDKKASKTAKTQDSAPVQDNDILAVTMTSSNALVPSATPQTEAIGGAYDDYSEDGQVSIYVVRSGDTIAQVAEMYGVTVDTILSANDLKKGEKLKEGEILLILPFSGIEHTVVKNDTLESLARKYKVDTDDILDANHINDGAKLAIGDKIIIPGASIPTEVPVKKPNPSVIVKKPGASATFKADGYFVNPVPGARRSRGTTASHQGVDLAARTGTPIRASAGGTVIFARKGTNADTSNGGYGTLVIIAHPNGTETLYAHMSKLGTSVGATVGQGETIGYVGNTGRSTGPHLHFEVRGAKNPGNDWSWAD